MTKKKAIAPTEKTMTKMGSLTTIKVSSSTTMSTTTTTKTKTKTTTMPKTTTTTMSQVQLQPLDHPATTLRWRRTGPRRQQ